MQYVGQTSRDIDTRYEEHIYDDSNSKIHKAIVEYGQKNFKLEEIEKVPLSKLDEREKYWISYYHTYPDGYNKTPGGKESAIGIYDNLYVVEKDIYIDSIEYFGRRCKESVGWSQDTIKNNIKRVVDTEETYLGYHFKKKKVLPEDLVDEDILTDWIKTIKKINCYKKVYSPELDKKFNSIGDASYYCIENNLYVSDSDYPMQELRTQIGRMVSGKQDKIPKMPTITFIEIYDKDVDSQSDRVNNAYSFTQTSVYCPEINKTFNSNKEAAQYFIDNKLFNGVKIKTARDRISDVCNGYIKTYKGYSFSITDKKSIIDIEKESF